MSNYELWLNIIGYAASISMILGYLPQAIVTMKTRDTDGIALPTFIMLGLGSVFFVVQGIMISNWPLVITNVVTTICSVIIFGIKIANDSKKKKNGVK
ncbi:MAG: SemiSWEET family transporter [Bacteroidales bacterium]|nr:SemiSWEET family transporter [Bacteroidales bacterium]